MLTCMLFTSHGNECVVASWCVLLAQCPFHCCIFDDFFRLIVCVCLCFLMCNVRIWCSDDSETRIYWFRCAAIGFGFTSKTRIYWFRCAAIGFGASMLFDVYFFFRFLLYAFDALNIALNAWIPLIMHNLMKMSHK